MQQLDMYVKRTLRAGIPPIEMSYQPIYDCYNGGQIAWRGAARVNSVIYGVLTPAEYGEAADMSPQGVELTFACLRKAMQTVTSMRLALRRFRWVSVFASASFLLCDGLYDRLTETIKQRQFSYPENICFELGEDVLQMDTPRARKGLSDIRAAGFKVAVRGCGNRDFPLLSLVGFTPDVVFVEEAFTALLSDRNKSAVVPALIRLARSLGIGVVAEGAYSDDCIRELNKNECVGFIPSAAYSGKLPCKRAAVSTDAVLAYKEA